MTVTSVNPARPDDVVATYPAGTAADVDRAVAAAAAAQRDWARVPVPARAEIIAAAGAVLAERKAELSHLVAAGGRQDPGRGGRRRAGGHRHGRLRRRPGPRRLGRDRALRAGQQALLDHPPAGRRRRHDHAVELPGGHPVVEDLPGAARRQRRGHQAVRARAGLLRGLRRRVHRRRACPQDLVQVVHGFAEPAAALATHPGVGAVSFTGSVPTGRKVAAAAMESGPRLVSLELGGKNAMVVRPDADLDLAVDGAVFGAFGTAGQRCTSTSRLIVHPDVAERAGRPDREAGRRARDRRPDRRRHRRRPGHRRARPASASRR